MDRRRHEDSRDKDYRRRDDKEDEYRGRSKYGRDDITRTRTRSKSRSTSKDRDRARLPRSKSPRRDYHDDKRSYDKSSYVNASKSNYRRDLDRPEVSKEKKDIEMRKSPEKEAVRPVETAENEELLE